MIMTFLHFDSERLNLLVHGRLLGQENKKTAFRPASNGDTIV
jgi:hypothetical protein